MSGRSRIMHETDTEYAVRALTEGRIGRSCICAERRCNLKGRWQAQIATIRAGRARAAAAGLAEHGIHICGFPDAEVGHYLIRREASLARRHRIDNRNHATRALCAHTGRQKLQHQEHGREKGYEAAHPNS